MTDGRAERWVKIDLCEFFRPCSPPRRPLRAEQARDRLPRPAQPHQQPDVRSPSRRPSPRRPDAPAHCRVFGQVLPQVGFEVRMPADWNGRFVDGGQRRLRRRTHRQPRPRQPVRPLHETRLRRRRHRHRALRRHRAAGHLRHRSPEAARLRLPLPARHRRDRQNGAARLLRIRACEILLRRLLHRRTPGPDSGAALSQRFRRHHRGRARPQFHRHHAPLTCRPPKP